MNAPETAFITTTAELAALCDAPRDRGIRHGRYRIHARAHLLPGTLPRPAGRHGGCRGGGCAGQGDRPRPARRAAGQAGRGQSLPRLPPGCRNLPAPVRRRARQICSTPRSPPWSPASATRSAMTRWSPRSPAAISTKPTASRTGPPARSPKRRSTMPRRTSRICAWSTNACWPACAADGRMDWVGRGNGAPSPTPPPIASTRNAPGSV